MVECLQAAYPLERYRIRRALDRDGVGVEYEAHVIGEDRAVTVREYLPEGLAQRSASGEIQARSPADKALFDAGLARFLAQYRTLKRIGHPAVIEVFECLHANGTGYAVMDHPVGVTLAARLVNGNRLTDIEIASVFGPILDGLAAMHQASLLHREISPDKFVIRQDGTPLIRGFGSARLVAGGPRQAFSHRPPGFLGLLTPGYAALEQYSNRGQEGPWTDIYALGAVMYRCVTGSTPIDAPGRAVQDDLIPAVRAASGLYDRSTLEAIDAALALRVAERPRSLAAWQKRLRVLGGREDSPPAPLGRLGARQFQRPDRKTSLAAGSSTGARAPVAGARAAIAGTRGDKESSRNEAGEPAANWAVPALAVAVLISLLTWLDTGLLRSRGNAGSPVPPPEATGVPGETRVAVQARLPTSTQPARQPGDPELRIGEADADRSAAHPVARASPPTPDPDNIAGNAARSEAIAPFGSLALELSPPDAVVTFMDDANRSYRSGMTLPEGEYRVRVSSADHGPEIRTFQLAGATQIPIALVPEPYPFTIATVPINARVTFVNGSVGYAPGIPLPPGDYRIVVTLPGFKPWQGVIPHGTAPTRHRITLTGTVTEFADTLASGGHGPTMVTIPPGAYRMGCVSGRDCIGNELPLRETAVDEPFALSKHEITYNDYDRFTQATRRRRAENPADWQRGAWPVVSVSWEDAAAFARWLAAETGRDYRLPSEAEWEYAARAHTNTAYSWGEHPGDARANCTGCDTGSAPRGTVRVGSFAANAWGLHDMHGNVWEWAADCAYIPGSALSSSAAEPVTANCRRRVRRGGSWAHLALRMISASRNVTTPELRSLDTGFRVLLKME